MQVDDSPTSNIPILSGKEVPADVNTSNTASNVNTIKDNSATPGGNPGRQIGLQVRTNLNSSGRQISDSGSGGLKINLRKATEHSLSPSYTPGYPTSHTFGKPEPVNPSPIVAIDSGSINRGPHILSPHSHIRSPSSLSNRLSRNLNHPYSFNMPAERRSSAGNALSSPSERHSSPVSTAGDIMGSPSAGMRQRARKERPSFPSSPRRQSDQAVRGSFDPMNTPSILQVPPSATPTQSFFSPSCFNGRQLNFVPPVSNARGEPATPVSAVTPGSARQAIPARNRQRTEAIPKAYVLKSLHNLAPHFWNNATTADCRLLVPIRNPDQSTPSPSQYATFNVPHSAATPTPTSSHTFGGVAPNLVNTRAFAATEVKESEVPQDRRRLMTLNLHRDYLVTQSSLLSQLLEPRMPAIRTSPSREPPPSAPSNISSFRQVTPPPLTSTDGKFPPEAESIRSAPALKGARILPTPSHVPTTVWLPLPDPSSLGVLIHYLYWGDSSKLENALSRGEISWQGVVKNIEYLGLDNNVKRVLGSWWRRWVKVAAGRQAVAPPHSANGNGAQRRGMDVQMREADDDLEEADEDEECADADGEMQTSDEESENSLRPRLKKISGRRIRKRDVDEPEATMVEDGADSEVAEKLKGL